MSAQEKDGGMIRNGVDYKCRWEPPYEYVGMIRCSENGSSPPSCTHWDLVTETPVTHICAQLRCGKERGETKKVSWLDNHGNADPVFGRASWKNVVRSWVLELLNTLPREFETSLNQSSHDQSSRLEVIALRLHPYRLTRLAHLAKHSNNSTAHPNSL